MKIFEEFDKILFEGLTGDQKEKMENQVNTISNKSINVIKK